MTLCGWCTSGNAAIERAGEGGPLRLQFNGVGPLPVCTACLDVLLAIYHAQGRKLLEDATVIE